MLNECFSACDFEAPQESRLHVFNSVQLCGMRKIDTRIKIFSQIPNMRVELADHLCNCVMRKVALIFGFVNYVGGLILSCPSLHPLGLWHVVRKPLVCVPLIVEKTHTQMHAREQR